MKVTTMKKSKIELGRRFQMYILSRRRPDGRYDYVSDLPGHGGKDWGYTTKVDVAIVVNEYWKRRFLADMQRVSAKNPGCVCIGSN